MNDADYADSIPGNILVVDSGNNNAQLFNAAHTLLLSWPARNSSSSWDLPQAVALDAAGNVFVVIRNDDCVRRYKPQ